MIDKLGMEFVEKVNLNRPGSDSWDWIGSGIFLNYIHTWQRVVSFFGMVSSRGVFLRVKSSDFQPSDKKPYKNKRYFESPGKSLFHMFPGC